MENGQPPDRRSSTGRPPLAPLRCHGFAADHLGEELDRHVLAVHPEPEVRRLEACHPVAILVCYNDFDVDHPDLDLLAEDGRRLGGPGSLGGERHRGCKSERGP